MTTWPNAVHAPTRLLAVLATACLAAAQAAPPAPPTATDPAGAPAGSWNARTAPAPADPPQGGTTRLKLRVYEGFDRPGPAGRDTPLAVDADVGLVTCADGNLQASGVSVGGTRLDAGEPCDGAAGIVRHEDGADREAAAGPAQPVPPPAPPCDPARWRCTTPAPATTAP